MEKEIVIIAIVATFILGFIAGIAIVEFSIPVCDCNTDEAWHDGFHEGWNLSEQIASCYNDTSGECVINVTKTLYIASPNNITIDWVNVTRV